MSGDVFDLTGADYWADPMRTMRAFAWDRIGDRIAGIVLGGPAEVDLDAHDTLPLIAFHSDTIAEMIRSPFHHAVVVASRLDEHDVRAAAAEIPEMHAPAPPPVPEPGFAGGPHLLDLREILGIPWTPGQWIVRVLLRDRQSNPLQVELFRGRERAPTAPAAPEIAIEAPRVVVRGPGAEARLSLHVRPPLFGAIPVTLVMIGSAHAGVVMQRLAVLPQELAGTLQTDLLHNAGIAGSAPQTFFVYAFSGQAMAGPALMGVVD